MIVAFQVAIYLAYELWENYLSFYFGNTEANGTNDIEPLNAGSTLNTNLDSNLTNSSVPDTINREVSGPSNEAHISSEQKAGPSSLDHDEKSQKMEKSDFPQVKNHHPCLYSDDLLDLCVIENNKSVEETFFCIYKEGKEITFTPPAYTQRYMVVEEVLKDQRWSDIKKVADFGCSELTFEVRYLKKLFNVQEIVAVDINFQELDYYKCKLIPNAVDFIDRRPTPLTVNIYCGNVGHTNKVLEGAEAVIAIELIEHLYPPDLDLLPFTVFGFIRPKIAMFTTPNADFNILFPDFSGLRHWDHKFEWSRQQFEDWANNIAKRYPAYRVSFRGITPGPPGSEHLGCLSQMATFIRNDSVPPLDENEVNVQEGPYNLVQETIFPYHEDKRSQYDIIKDEAVSFIRKCAMLSHYNDYPDGDERKEIPLKNIMERIQFFNRKKLVDILTEEKFEIVTNKDGHEMLILPESEDESESCEEDFSNDYVVDSEENFLNTNCQSESVGNENWDIELPNQPTPLIENLANDFLRSDNTYLEQTDIPSTDTLIPLSIKEDDNYSNLRLEHDCKEIVASCDRPYDSKLMEILSLSPFHTETAFLERKNVSNNDKTDSVKSKKNNRRIRSKNHSKELLSSYDAAAISENLSAPCLNAGTELLKKKYISDTKSSPSAKSKNYLRPGNDSKKLFGSYDKPHCTEFTESLTVAFIKAEAAFLKQINMSNTAITQSAKSKEIFKYIRPENESKELHASIDKPHSEFSENLSSVSLHENTAPLEQNNISVTADPLSGERKENDQNLRLENDCKQLHASYDKPDCTEFTDNFTVAFLNAETEFFDKIKKNNTSIAESTKSEENKMKITRDNVFEDMSLNNGSNVSLDHENKLSYPNDHSGSDMSLEDTQIDNVMVDDSLAFNCAPNNLSSDLLTPDSLIKMFSPEEKNKTNESPKLECSVYETPFHDWLRSASKSELYNPSAHSLYHNEHSPHGDCKRELIFESPLRMNENQPTIDSVVDSPSYSGSVVSSLELSYYATPCSNEIHNTRVLRSLSIQDLNGICNSPLSALEGGLCLSTIAKGGKKDKISKSMDGFRSQESCDIHDTCSSTSKVLDSGYPDSFSDHIIDSDSIKFDDIETESEGENLNSPLPSPVAPNEPPLRQIVVNNVENGDVANNNRDGEGNNMVADMEEDFFEFEAQIEEVLVPNDAVLARDCSDSCSQSDNSMHDSSSNVNASEYNSQDYSPPSKPSDNETLKTRSPLKDCSRSVKLNYGDKNETTDVKSIKSAQSDTNIYTISSWNCIKSSESVSKIEPERRQGDHSKVGRDNSLTTVLEGYSRFSDCSLVRPIETSSSSNNEDGLVGYAFPKWMLSIDGSVFESEAKKTNESHHSFTTLQPNLSQRHLSSPSIYQSVNSSPVESDSEDANSDSPKRHLEVQVSDTEESNIAVFNSDFSMVGNETDDLDFDVQVDARGGGDPQRDNWLN